MKFFFCGGSNIDQKKVKDYSLEYEQKYPYIVSQHFNAGHINEGMYGASNKRTIRKIFYEYDMNEFDFISIEITHRTRTEFYNDQEKNWIKFLVERADKEKILNTYYTELYNETYGKIQYEIDLTTIKKYLIEIKKPFILINTSNKKDWHSLNHDFTIFDYHTNLGHLTPVGHKMLAKDIIKYYENILQR